jgi:hypothetical protein
VTLDSKTARGLVGHLWHVTIPSASTVPVQIVVGAGEPQRFAPSLPVWIWTAKLEASEPIVGQLILRWNGRCQWAKTTDQATDTLVLSAAIYPGVDGQEARWPIPPLFRCQCAGATVQEWLDAPTTPRPIALPTMIQTGSFTRLLVVDSVPQLEVGILTVVRQEVRFGRKRNWRYRDALRASVLPGRLGEHWRGRHRDDC